MIQLIALHVSLSVIEERQKKYNFILLAFSFSFIFKILNFLSNKILAIQNRQNC